MNRYILNGREAIVLDGKLFVEAEQVAEGPVLETSDGPVGDRRYKSWRKTVKKLDKKIGSGKGRVGRKRIGPEARQLIIDDIKAGKRSSEIMEEHDISSPTYYAIKKQMESGKVMEPTTYVCDNEFCGVRTKSFKDCVGERCFKCESGIVKKAK